MACFVVPAVEAVAVTAAYLAAKKHEQKISAPKLANGNEAPKAEANITWSKRLSWLMGLLWGGVLLLAFEHFWHGEVVPFPPFLTAMADPEDTAEMLHEMATAGVLMAVLVTAVWAVMLVVTSAIEKRAAKSQLQEQN